MTATSQAETAQKPSHKRKCGWCGIAFETADHRKQFCTRAHKIEFNNFCASRGKVLMPIALAWRTSRGRKGVGAEALAEMVRFLDQCAAELTEQGAPPVAKHYGAIRGGQPGAWLEASSRRPQRERVRQP